MVKPLTYGRMGNFLFQAAAAMGYAFRHGLQFTLPDSTKDAKDNPIYLQHLVHPGWNRHLQSVTIEEGRHSYQPLPYAAEWIDKNVILDGYWQSEKYFKEFRAEILQGFAFPWECRRNEVSVHVRRGDYLALTKKHPPVPVAWIEQAMSLFGGERKFVFFSDDLPWCRETFGNRDDVVFYDGIDEVDDLARMSQCEHHICSCSTFSWWGAWLNQNPDKRVVMPQNWFVPGYKGIETKDIVPQEWERL